MGLNRTERAMSGSKLIACAFVAASLCGCFSSSSYTPELVFVSGFGFNAVPALTAISPQQASLGAPATTLTVSGTGFRPASQVTWNGVVLQTTFVSSTSMTAIVPAPLLTIAGDGWVQISEPGCTQPCTPLSSVIVFNVGSSTR